MDLPQPALTSDGPRGHSAASPDRRCCRSSVVERILGKAEVGSSILPDGTTPLPLRSLMSKDPKPTPAEAREARLAEALRANLRRRKGAPAQKSDKPGG